MFHRDQRLGTASYVFSEDQLPLGMMEEWEDIFSVDDSSPQMEDPQTKERVPLTKENFLRMFDFSRTEFAPQHLENLKNLLWEKKDAFALHEGQVGTARSMEVDIQLKGTPGKSYYPRYSPEQKEMVRKFVNLLIDNGVAEISSDVLYHFPVVFVAKKGGGLRVTLDLRRLNAVASVIPPVAMRFEDVFETLRGSSWYMSLDMSSGYYNLPLTKESRRLVGIISPDQHLVRLTKLPQGYSQGSSVFQRYMMNILSDQIGKGIHVWIDDLLGYAKSEEELLQILTQVLDKVIAENLKIKPSKTRVGLRKIVFCGVEISGEGLRPSEDKLEQVKKMPTPANLKELQSALAFLNWFRRHIPDFAGVSAILYRLLRKDEPWTWTAKHSEAWEELKRRLLEAQVLVFPDTTGSLPYVLETDASSYAVSYALFQKQESGELRPVAFGSSTLTKTQTRYSVSERELLAICEGLRRYSPWLKSHHFRVISDHMSLSFLHKFKDVNARVQRWLVFLSQFSFDVTYRSGKNHQFPDSLSRFPFAYSSPRLASDFPQCEPTVPLRRDTASQTEAPWSEQGHSDAMGTGLPAAEAGGEGNVESSTVGLLTQGLQHAPEAEAECNAIGLQAVISDVEWCERQKADPILGGVHLWFSENSFPKTASDSDLLYYLKAARAGDLKVQHGCLVHKNRPVVPQSLLPVVLSLGHDSILGGGHLGTERTLQVLDSRVHCKGLKELVTNWVQSCTVCAVVKIPCRTVRAPLQSYGEVEGLGATFHVDFFGPINPVGSTGARHVLICVDRCTKFPEVFPTKDVRAETVAEILFTQLFPRYGVVRRVVSDRGGCFESRVMQEYCALMGIKKARTTSFHAMSNGAAERAVKETKLQLGLYLRSCPADRWDQLLQLSVYNLRAAKHNSIGMSPFEAVYGMPMRTPLDIVVGRAPRTGIAITERVRRELTEIQPVLRRNLELSRQKYTKAYNKKVWNPELKIGDRVFLQLPPTQRGVSPSLQAKGSVAFRVVGFVGPVDVRIQRENSDVTLLVHRNRLRLLPERHVHFRLESEPMARPEQAKRVPGVVPIVLGRVPNPRPVPEQGAGPEQRPIVPVEHGQVGSAARGGRDPLHRQPRHEVTEDQPLRRSDRRRVSPVRLMYAKKGTSFV
jgi:hypothetical protein